MSEQVPQIAPMLASVPEGVTYGVIRHPIALPTYWQDEGPAN